ncbi:hypothetical protein ACP70R_008403 [Stipagrostis hirtigluma subsp. patula]
MLGRRRRRCVGGGAGGRRGRRRGQTARAGAVAFLASLLATPVGMLLRAAAERVRVAAALPSATLIGHELRAGGSELPALRYGDGSRAGGDGREVAREREGVRSGWVPLVRSGLPGSLSI